MANNNMRSKLFRLSLACCVALAGIPALAQADDHAGLNEAQARANALPGPRALPARTVPVPTGLDPATAALVAAPYSAF